jgi:hypothetical protein
MVRVQITNGRMDRVRPGALRPYITNEDWIQLANDIGTALWPVMRFIRLRSTTIPAIAFLLFLFGIVTIVMSFLGTNWYYYYNDQDDGFDRYTLGFLICSASIVFLMVTMMVLNIYKTACLESRVQHALENVLQQFSDDNQGGRITAHLIHQHDAAVIVYHGGEGGNRDYHDHALTGNYLLEISIDGDHCHRHCYHKEQQQHSSSSDDYQYLAEEEEQQQQQQPPARPPNASSTFAMTVRQRLERLEQVRDAVSDEEYQERRRIILDEL